MLSSRLLPANTPRQRLSMARDATLRVRLGLRGQGISCTNFHCPCLAENRGEVGWGLVGKQSHYYRRMERK